MHDVQRALQKESEIDPEYLRELFQLEADGRLLWRVGRGRPGAEAGTLSRGYKRVGFDGRLVMAHRVVWTMHYGRWPRSPLDHIDGDRLNNRVSNLREASFVENGRNMRRHSNNTSGVTGVSWCGTKKQWLSRVRVNGAHTHLGYFDNLLDAVAARKSAERRLGFHPNHGRG